MLKQSKLYIFIGLIIGMSSGHAQEYEPWTGSVVGATIHFGTHDSLVSIRRLINEGKTSEAVLMAQTFVNSLSRNDRIQECSDHFYPTEILASSDPLSTLKLGRYW